MLKAVFLTEEIPSPAPGSNRARKSQLIRLLAEQTELEVLCFDSRRFNREHLGIPEEVALTAIEREREPFWRRWAHPLRPGQFEGLSESMVDALRVRAEPGKLLWISGSGVSPYIPVGSKLGYRVIFDEHATEIRHRLQKDKYLGAFGSFPTFFSSVQGGFYKSRMCQQADAVITGSDLNASQLGRQAPGSQVFVLPDTVECERYASVRATQGESLLFFGPLDSSGNLRGISWFIDEVMPRLRASLRDRTPRVVVAGWNPPRHLVRRLHYEKIELHGNPKSILPLLQDAALAFFPQRYGESSNHHILEAMAAGRPVVSTPKAAEGLLFSPTYDILIADRADAFTRALVQLLDNREFRAATAEHALETVHSRYDNTCARGLIERLLKHLEETPNGGRARQKPRLHEKNRR